MISVVEIELERTFLAAVIPPEVYDANPQRVVDIYVPEDSEHPSLRIRQKGDSYEITKKRPAQGDVSKQTEQTIPLTANEFASLSKTSFRRVVKDRYIVQINGRDAEIDVFLEKLDGLALIDFEFSSEEEKASFEAPPCCLADVTQETFIAGGMLAGKSYEDIEKDLERFHYKKLVIG